MYALPETATQNSRMVFALVAQFNAVGPALITPLTVPLAIIGFVAALLLALKLFGFIILRSRFNCDLSGLSDTLRRGLGSRPKRVWRNNRHDGIGIVTHDGFLVGGDIQPPFGFNDEPS